MEVYYLEYCKQHFGPVFVDGYIYHQNSLNSAINVRYLVCSELKRLSCKARATVSRDSGDILVTGSHNHLPVHKDNGRTQFVALIKQYILAQGGDVSLRDIYNCVAERHPDTAAHYSYKNLAPSMRRWRQQARNGVLL